MNQKILKNENLVIDKKAICYETSKDPPYMNTFCCWLSETIVISVYEIRSLEFL